MHQKIFDLADHLAEVARAGKLASRPVAMLPGIAVTGLGARAHGPAMHAATLSAIDGGRSAGRTLPGPRPAAGGAVHRFGITQVG